MTALSIRRNFLWNFVGNTVYNVVLWLLLVVLARLGDAEVVGEFALMLAISAPVFMLVGLNLRVVRATDVRRVWTPAQYRRLRFVLNGVALLVTMALGPALGLRGESLLALLMVAGGKAVEATSLMIYGFFQLRERLDLVSRSLLLRAAFGAFGFIGLFVLADKLWLASLGMTAGWFLVWVIHDRPAERKLLVTDGEAAIVDLGRASQEARTAPSTLWSLARKAFPLGLDAGIGSLAINAPRFAVQLLLGPAALGVFATLAYAAQVVSMVTGALGDAVVGPLAKVAVTSDRARFRGLLVKLVLFGLGVSLATALFAALAGGPLISAVLGPEYARLDVLVVLLIGAGAVTTQRSLARGLQALHDYSLVLLVDTVVMTASVFAAVTLIPLFGLVGAAATVGCGFAAGIGLSLVLLRRRMRSMEPEDEDLL